MLISNMHNQSVSKVKVPVTCAKTWSEFEVEIIQSGTMNIDYISETAKEIVKLEKNIQECITGKITKEKLNPQSADLRHEATINNKPVSEETITHAHRMKYN